MVDILYHRYTGLIENVFLNRDCWDRNGDMSVEVNSYSIKRSGIIIFILHKNGSD